jgi:hypothetical protein
MAENRRFLVDVGIKDLPFPMRVVSKVDPEGQHTIANISVSARIMREFDARWIDKFIQIVHRHKDRIGTRTLSENIIEQHDHRHREDHVGFLKWIRGRGDIINTPKSRRDLYIPWRYLPTGRSCPHRLS